MRSMHLFLRPRRGTFVIWVLMSLACHREPTTVIEEAVVVRSSWQSARPASVRAEEQPFDDIAQSVPGFGGFFVTEAGEMVAWVTDRANEAAARSAVDNAVRPLRASGRIATRGAVQVRLGQFTFWQLARARDLLFDAALGRVKGVHGLDLDERTNRVAVYVTPDESSPAVEAVRELLRRDGLDTNIVDLRIKLAPTLEAAARVAAPAPQAYSLFSGADTIVGGLKYSKANGSACTVGVVATYGGSTGMVSATHCSADWFVVDGTVVYFSAGGGQAFGSETVDPTGTYCWYFRDNIWGNFHCRWSDAAFWQMNGSVPAAKGLIARTTYAAGPGGGTDGSTILDTARPYFLITSTTGALIGGERVQKVGWASGWTYGDIDETCRDNYSNEHVFKCQYAAAYWSKDGDSGGPVFQIDYLTGDVRLAGLHSARDGGVAIFSPWWRVSDEFGGGLSPTRGYALGTPSMSGYLSGSHPVVTWGAVTGATEYQLLREWFNYQTGESGSLVTVGSPSSPAIDYDMTVDAYTGSSIPGPHTLGYVAYYLIARNKTDRSQLSEPRYFRLAP